MAVPRYFHKELAQYFTLPGTIIAPIQITFGASGAVASFKGMFLQNAVRNSAGNYTLTFERPLRYFMGANGTHWKLVGATEPLTVCSTAASLDNTGTTGSTPNTMVIETRAAGVATDPASGDILYWWPAWNETQVL